MRISAFLAAVVGLLTANPTRAEPFQVTEDENEIRIVSEHLEATIRKKGYVTGVAAGTFVDKKTGFRDAGFGLDIVDWIMEPGSDEAYRDKLPDHMVYHFGNDYHGKTPKRSLEGPQICTKAGELSPRVIRGKDFVAVQMDYTYPIAAPGHQPGSTWTQTLVFPEGKRYFISSDHIEAVNSSEAMFLRIDIARPHQATIIPILHHANIPSTAENRSALMKIAFPVERNAFRSERIEIRSTIVNLQTAQVVYQCDGLPWGDPPTCHVFACRPRGDVLCYESLPARLRRSPR